MKYYPIINRLLQSNCCPSARFDRDPNLQNIVTRTELGRQITEAFANLKPFTIDCDYAGLEWPLKETK